MQTEVKNSDSVVNIKRTTLTHKNMHGKQNLAKSGLMTPGRKSRKALFDAEFQIDVTNEGCIYNVFPFLKLYYYADFMTQFEIKHPNLRIKVTCHVWWYVQAISALWLSQFGLGTFPAK